jgi:hypothetical protein
MIREVGYVKRGEHDEINVEKAKTEEKKRKENKGEKGNKEKIGKRGDSLAPIRPSWVSSWPMLSP